MKVLERSEILKKEREKKHVPTQTCFCLPMDPTVTHIEGLAFGSEDVGRIYPFIVVLISQSQAKHNISLPKLAADQK